MTIFWTEIDLDDPTASSREAGFDPDSAVGPIWTRKWERTRTGLHPETLQVYIGLWGPSHRAMSWFYARWDGDQITPDSYWHEGPLLNKVGDDYDVQTKIATITPDDLPAGNSEGFCPAWAWNMTEVAEYRNLSSAASARRWINEVEPTICIFERDVNSGAKIVNGHDVVRAARAMVGRGKGGGRPPRPARPA